MSASVPLAGVAGAGQGAALELDRLIHERMRLAIVSALAVNETLTFNELKRLLDTTDGNMRASSRTRGTSRAPSRSRGACRGRNTSSPARVAPRSAAIWTTWKRSSAPRVSAEPALFFEV